MLICCYPKGARCEGQCSPEVSRSRSAVRVRRELEDPVDQAAAAPGNMLELQAVLHGPPEDDRHGRPRRAIYQEVRGADLREPKEGRAGQEVGKGRNRLVRQQSRLGPAFHLPLDSGETMVD